MLTLSVAKFGGTSVADYASMLASANIIINDADTKVVVLSASAGVTNLLLSLANGCDEKSCQAYIQKIQTIQNNILVQLKNPEFIRSQINAILKTIEKLASQARLTKSKELTDELICQGEMISSLIFVELLRELNIDAHWIDVRNIIATDCQFGKAAPNDKQTKINSDQRLKPLVESGKLIVTQGFIGRAPNNKTTTLGRGGSDYSAALLAEVLGADKVFIWTDVAGIYTTDPRIVPAAKRIKNMSFAEAAELATFGAKVLHPATLQPAVRSNIPVYVASSKDPNAGGTWVTKIPLEAPTFRAVALRREQTLLTLTNLSMLHAQCFLAKIFEILAKYKITVDVITTSEVSVALVLDKTASSTSYCQEILSQELLAELGDIASLNIESSLSLITLVGNKLQHKAGVAKQVFDNLENFNIRMINYGASANNISLLVQSQEEEKILQVLHKNLFEI